MNFPVCKICGETITFNPEISINKISENDFIKCANFALFIHNKACHNEEKIENGGEDNE